jgi:DNA-nicking Smr family endonuclease
LSKRKKSHLIRPEDQALFRQAVQDVTPLHTDRLPLSAPKPKPIARQRQLDEQQVIHDMLSEHYDPSQWETGEELLFMRPGVQHSVLQKLRRGQYSIHAELDLHGMVVSVARVSVGEFLHECRARGVRCARIIHGKGYGSWQRKPVLKAKLNKWLQQRDEVMAFCSARQVDGGTGAIYVLLKT